MAPTVTLFPLTDVSTRSHSGQGD
ncbi:hypothetical protein DNTS_023464, partial [Danionella cerebrum]